MKVKTYVLSGAGGYYKIHENGNIERTDIKDLRASGNWKLMGMDHHHFCNSLTWNFETMKKIANSGKSVNGYVHDIDHGTPRRWCSPKGKYTFYKA